MSNEVVRLEDKSKVETINVDEVDMNDVRLMI